MSRSADVASSSHRSAFPVQPCLRTSSASAAAMAGHLRIGRGAGIGAQAEVMLDLDPGRQSAREALLNRRLLPANRHPDEERKKEERTCSGSRRCVTFRANWYRLAATAEDPPRVSIIQSAAHYLSREPCGSAMLWQVQRFRRTSAGLCRHQPPRLKLLHQAVHQSRALRCRKPIWTATARWTMARIDDFLLLFSVNRAALNRRLTELMRRVWRGLRRWHQANPIGARRRPTTTFRPSFTVCSSTIRCNIPVPTFDYLVSTKPSNKRNATS